MTFPFLFEEGFEQGGTLGGFNSETDTQPKLDFPHYSALAVQGREPWRGAYCCRIDLSIGTTQAYLEELEGFDVAGSTAAAFRMYFYAGTDLVMANNDTFDLLQWQSAGPVNEFSINLLMSSGIPTIRGGDTGGAAFRSVALSLGKWHCLELVINTGSGADGTAAFFLDGRQIGATLTGIASAALTQARLGAIGIDAGTTAGTLLFDDIIVDDTRVYPVRERYPQSFLVTKSGHVALGNGQVGMITLLSGGTDNACVLYDTDEANIADAGNVVGLASSAVANETQDVYVGAGSRSTGIFSRGCYANLTGTNPRAVVTFHECLMNPSMIRQQGLRRKPSPV